MSHFELQTRKSSLELLTGLRKTLNSLRVTN